jgi:hypothetical protein
VTWIPERIRRKVKLEETSRRAVQRSDCKGLEWSALIKRVAAAVDPADGDVMDKIVGFMAEAHATPYANAYGPVKDEQGNQVYERHHFDYWLLGLQHGSWSLPDRMPRSALENFASRHGCVLRRCEDCRMGLPNGAILFQTCPVCGSANLSHKKLSGPPWDPHWVYTPLSSNGKVSTIAVEVVQNTSITIADSGRIVGVAVGGTTRGVIDTPAADVNANGDAAALFDATSTNETPEATGNHTGNGAGSGPNIGAGALNWGRGLQRVLPGYKE